MFLSQRGSESLGSGTVLSWEDVTGPPKGAVLCHQEVHSDLETAAISVTKTGKAFIFILKEM